MKNPIAIISIILTILVVINIPKFQSYYKTKAPRALVLNVNQLNNYGELSKGISKGTPKTSKTIIYTPSKIYECDYLNVVKDETIVVKTFKGYIILNKKYYITDNNLNTSECKMQNQISVN